MQPPEPTQPELRLLAGQVIGAGHFDGLAAQARFNAPLGVAVDPHGVAYVADTDNNVIRRIAPDGVVTTIAGTVGKRGSADGNGAAARFHSPTGLALDGQGSLYVADPGAHTVRRIDLATGLVSTVAGKAGFAGAVVGDGGGVPALLNAPVALAFAGGRLLIVDQKNHAVRQLLQPQLAVPYAGTLGQPGDAVELSAALQAQFRHPSAIAVHPQSGNLLVLDANNCVIRLISGDIPRVSLFAGVNRQCETADGEWGAGKLDTDFTIPISGLDKQWRAGALAVDASGRIFVGDSSPNAALREANAVGALRSLQVSKPAPAPGVPAPSWKPAGVLSSLVFDAQQQRLVTADPAAHSIRAVKFPDQATHGQLTTLAGQAEITQSVLPATLPPALSLARGDNGSLLVVQNQYVSAGPLLRRITADGQIQALTTPLAGATDRSASLVAEGGGLLYVAVDQHSWDLNDPVTRLNVYSNGQVVFSFPSVSFVDTRLSPLYYPMAIALDNAGRLLIADADATIHRVEGSGLLTTIAGKEDEYGDVLGDALNQARFLMPIGLAAAPSGDIFVLDFGGQDNYRIVKIAPVSGVDVVSLVASGGFNEPSGLTVDANGDLYVTEKCRVVRVRPDGSRETIAGTSSACTFVPGALADARIPGSTWSPVVQDGRLRFLIEDGSGIAEILPLPVAGVNAVAGGAELRYGELRQPGAVRQPGHRISASHPVLRHQSLCRLLPHRCEAPKGSASAPRTGRRQ